MPAFLMFVALSGGLRIDVRPAALSTFVALAAYAFFAVSRATPSRQIILIGTIIFFSGIVGANAARISRYMVLKACKEDVLERYVPKNLTQELAQSGDVEKTGRLEEVTLLLADIRGYTHISEQLTPAAAVTLLNDYFAVIAPLIAESGMVDKYIGDGILGFREGPDHAKRALRAARAMLVALNGFNAKLDLQEPIRIGIAVHSGEVILGTIGTPLRRDCSPDRV